MVADRLRYLCGDTMSNEGLGDVVHILLALLMLSNGSPAQPSPQETSVGGSSGNSKVGGSTSTPKPPDDSVQVNIPSHTPVPPDTGRPVTGGNGTNLSNYEQRMLTEKQALNALGVQTQSKIDYSTGQSIWTGAGSSSGSTSSQVSNASLDPGGTWSRWNSLISGIPT